MKVLEEEITEKWELGLTAKEIGKALGFGVPGTAYVNLKTYHVYYIRSNMGLPKRKGGIEKGKSRYKTQPGDIERPSPEEYYKMIDGAIPIHKNVGGEPYEADIQMRCLLWFMYNAPMRICEYIGSEDYPGLRLKDVAYQKGVDAYEFKVMREKKLTKGTIVPFLLPADFRGVDEIINYIDYLNNKYPDNKNIKIFEGLYPVKVWRKLKILDSRYYAHLWRFLFIRDIFLNNGNMLDVKTSVSISAQATDNYMKEGSIARMLELKKRRANVGKQ
jgi:hypothetical protein